jgi:hypothetical protein
MIGSEIQAYPPEEPPPTAPVVPCLSCLQSFVWWVHPVQLCDACIDRELTSAAPKETSTTPATPHPYEEI